MELGKSISTSYRTGIFCLWNQGEGINRSTYLWNPSISLRNQVGLPNISVWHHGRSTNLCLYNQDRSAEQLHWRHLKNWCFTQCNC